MKLLLHVMIIMISMLVMVKMHARMRARGHLSERVVIGRFIGHREHTATAPKPSTFPASHTAKLSTWYARKSPNSRPSAHPPMDMPWRLARFLKNPASLFGVCPVLDMCTRTPVLVATVVCRSPQCRECKRVAGLVDSFAWPGQGDRLKAAGSGWVKGNGCSFSRGMPPYQRCTQMGARTHRLKRASASSAARACAWCPDDALEKELETELAKELTS